MHKKTNKIMKKLIAYTQVALSYIFLLPHILCYLLCGSKKRELIYSDCRKLNDKMSVRMIGLKAVLYVIIRDPFYRKMFYHRLGLISILFSWYFPGDKTFYPMCSEIGEGVYLAHPTSTFLNAKSIGKNFTCRQNTTLGNKMESDKDSKPTIGDNVSVGANVCIIGNIHIGDNTIIGAGSVIVKDVPANSIVVGNPSRIINK